MKVATVAALRGAGHHSDEKRRRVRASGRPGLASSALQKVKLSSTEHEDLTILEIFPRDGEERRVRGVDAETRAEAARQAHLGSALQISRIDGNGA